MPHQDCRFATVGSRLGVRTSVCRLHGLVTTAIFFCCLAVPAPAGDPIGACCKPDESCANLTEADCALVLPLSEPRLWQAGEQCGVAGQHCPRPACMNATGDCRSAEPKRCNGGPDDGETCDRDADCGGSNDGVCADTAPTCHGGDQAGASCLTDLDCLPGGLCTTQICSGGARAGDRCEATRDCRESFCEGSPGCSDPFCCDLVCDQDSFCCLFDWDKTCSDRAVRDCTVSDCNANGVPDDTDITAGTSSDANGNGIPDECEPGACCDHTDGSCTDGVALSDCAGPMNEGLPDVACADVVCDVRPFVPASSEWGLVVALLLALALGTTAFRRRGDAVG